MNSISAGPSSLIRINNRKPALADFRKAWALKKNEQYALGIGSLLLESKPSEALVFLKEALTRTPRKPVAQPDPGPQL